MPRSLIRWFVLAAALGATSAAAQPRDLEELGCGKARAAYMMEQAGLSTERPFVRGSDAEAAYSEMYPDTDVLENDLDLEFILAPRTVKGTNTMAVRAVTSGVSEFTIILHPNYTASALINGVTPAVMTPTGTWGRRITLDRAYAADEIFTVTVTYTGAPPPPTGFGGFVMTTRSGKPEVWTLSQAFAAGCWWPCKDGDYGLPGDNSDKATLKIAITGPSTMKTTSNGSLQGVDNLGGGRSRTRFKTDYPLSTYLVCFASTDFNTWTPTWSYDGHDMPVEFNFYSEQDTPTARTNAGRVLDMLTVFSNLFGTYPFVNEKYGIYQFGFGGGMEHQTNTGQGFFDGGWLSAHELAHQWWGDNLTCKDWHHIWLNEGFATYCEALWEEFKPGSTGTPAMLAYMNTKKPGNPNGSVYCTNTTSNDTIFNNDTTYRKGGWVMHMLRYVIGDEAFFGSLRDYRATFENKAPVTDDFAAAVSARVGTDMSYFFRQWVYGLGTPAYRVAFQNVTINSANYTRVYLSQVQSIAWGDAGVFRMPVELRMGAQAASPVVNAINTARAQWYLFPIDTPPAAITIDPTGRILTSSKTTTSWVAGPAKIAQSVPASSATLIAAANLSSMKLFFSEDVSVTESKLALAGPSGPVPFTLGYDAPTFAATISFAALPAGTYTLTVSEQVKSQADKLLDGEIGASSALPSGDGLPGGDAVLSFTIRCTSDINNDGQSTLDDFFAFFDSWDTGAPAADLNQDGTNNLDDYFAFFAGFDTGC